MEIDTFGYTPICNSCGITENYDISDAEYHEDKRFWDDWFMCKECLKFLEEPKKEYWRWNFPTHLTYGWM